MLIDSLKNYTTEELVEALNDKSVLVRCGVISECARRKNVESAVTTAIAARTKSTDAFWNNYFESDFAEAALHILNVKKYKGKRREVKQLISARLQFD